MGANIKLKDLYNEEQSFTDIGTIAVPKTDGSGDTYYVQRPIINYTLQDPPTRELTDADAGAFAWNAGDGTVFEGDLGNFIGSVKASAAGKTTRPIVDIGANKHLSGVTVNANGAAILIYLYEELSGSVLLDVLGETGNTDFTAQVGWGQLLLADTSPLEITGYAKINDPGAVTIGIEQPVGYQKADIFYSLLSEVTQEEQTVSVTENGAQTIVPTAGKSGIRKVALNVNVPSSGGNLQEKSVSITSNGTTEVTPDAGYDGMSKLTATVNVEGGGSDYYLLQNPTGTMPTYPNSSKTFAHADAVIASGFKPYIYRFGNSNANEAYGVPATTMIDFRFKEPTADSYANCILFINSASAATLSQDILQLFLGSSWTFGAMTLAVGWNVCTFTVDDSGTTTAATCTATTIDAINMTLQGYGGIPKNNFDWAAMDAYTLSFFKDAASKEQANWNQNDSTAADHVKNRPGGFFTGLSGEVPSKTYTFDGDLTGKEVAWAYGDASEGVGFVKVSSDAPWYYQLFGGSVVVYNPQGDETVQLNTPIVIQKNLDGVIMLGECGFVVRDDYEVSPGITLTAGIWFTYMHGGGVTSYTKSLTTVSIADASVGDFDTEPLSLNAIPQLVSYDQKSLYLYSDNGTKYAITVDDTGTLTATEVTN